MNLYLKLMNYLFYNKKSDWYRVLSFYMLLLWIVSSILILNYFHFNFEYPSFLSFTPLVLMGTYYLLHGNIPGTTMSGKSDRDERSNS